MLNVIHYTCETRKHEVQLKIKRASLQRVLDRMQNCDLIILLDEKSEERQNNDSST